MDVFESRRWYQIILHEYSFAETEFDWFRYDSCRIWIYGRVCKWHTEYLTVRSSKPVPRNGDRQVQIPITLIQRIKHLRRATKRLLGRLSLGTSICAALQCEYETASAVRRAGRLQYRILCHDDSEYERPLTVALCSIKQLLFGLKMQWGCLQLLSPSHCPRYIINTVA